MITITSNRYSLDYKENGIIEWFSEIFVCFVSDDIK